MIAITFALPAESSDLLRSVGKDEIATLHTGVGGKAAAAKIDKFLSVERPKLLISSGFAGGLHDQLQVGDLIFAENYSDRRLLDRAAELLANHGTQRAKLFSASAIADSAEDRTALREKHNADAVDMETEVIAAACIARGIPMLSLRAITDTPRQPLPVPPEVLFDLERQRTSFVRLAGYCISHPAAIRRLMRFSNNVALARAELASALRTLLREQRLLY